MRSEWQSLSSTGQNLKSETESFSKEDSGIDLSHLRPLLPKVTAGAMQPALETTIDQDDFASKLFIRKQNLVRPKRIPWGPVSTLRTKQLWEGTVIACENGRFTARIADRTNPTNPDELATFLLEEVSPDDQGLISPGASFYWIVGTEQTPAGQVKNIAVLNFRRLPRWNKSSFRKAKERARHVLSVFSHE